jgi:nitrate/nitrite-specific signal transduction histidine kinase
LYNGIKEIVSSNYSQRLNIDGNDELSEISLVFNEMSDKLMKTKQKMSVTLHEELVTNMYSKDIEELKIMLSRIRVIGEQAAALISRFEKK